MTGSGYAAGMAEEHDWLPFDEEQQLEVRSWEGVWQVRRIGTDHPRVNLSDAEWEQVRAAGPDPDVMARLHGG